MTNWKLYIKCCKTLNHEVTKVTKKHVSQCFCILYHFIEIKHTILMVYQIPSQNFCVMFRWTILKHVNDSITNWKSLICLNCKTLFSFLVIDFFKISTCCTSIYQRGRQESWTALENLCSIMQAITYFKLKRRHCVFIQHTKPSFSIFCYHSCSSRLHINPLSANPTKWSNTLKQLVGNLPANCLSVFDHFVGLALKVLKYFCFWSRVPSLEPFQ